MNEECFCDIESALYNDMGVVKCQYCMGAVDKERADEWKKYNTPVNHNAQDL